MSQVETSNDVKKVNVNTQAFLCPNCGGTIKYDIESESFRCEACKAPATMETLSSAVKEYDFSQYAQREQQSVAFEGLAVAQCRNCGYEITFDDMAVATTCPMCGSVQIATVKQAAGIPPEGIVPFKVDKNEAIQKFKAWVKSIWFAPNDFKKKYGMGGELKGMYLPFWTYDASVVAFYQGRGGNTRTRTDKDGNRHTETDWTYVSGVVNSEFNDIQICASDREKDIGRILPYNTVENTKPYTAAYLSGYYAELYKIKADAAFEKAKAIMENHLRSLAEQDIRRRYDKADVNSIQAKYSDVTYKHVLLPVWASTFAYKGKTYRYLVNGETGKVAGQRPYSPIKVMIAIAAAVAVIVGFVLIIQLI